jgi:type IV pilus assembly protein PilM
MSPLGIYFGSKTITVSETKGKKLVNNLFITPPTSSSTNELQDASDAEIKAIEIIALFKSELRRSKINASEAVLCLPGKDLIIRTFDMPVMPKNELHEAVYFEAKKYIPFKIDELISAYQAEFNKSTKTNSVLFIGMKKEVLDRYFALLSQLNIKITAVEYSAFSVLRSFKLSGINDSGIVGILEADLNGEEEINFTILENGLPLFTRDFNLATDADLAVGDTIAETGDKSAAALEKLKTELRVSLDYYHRKYPTKNIQKIYFNCNPECRAELEAFMSENGLNAHGVDLVKVCGKQVSYSSGLVRSYSASLFNSVNSKVKVNVLAAKTKQRAVVKEKGASSELAGLFEGVKLDVKVITLAILIAGGVFGYGFYQVQLARQALENTIKLRPAISSVAADASYDELSNKKTAYKKKIETLENLIKTNSGVTVPLNAIPQAISPGLWLNELTYNKDQDKVELIFKGTVFLADSDKEFDAVNSFISKLRGEAGFAKYFKNVSLDSFDRVKEQDITVAKFLISCKAN